VRKQNFKKSLLFPAIRNVLQALQFHVLQCSRWMDGWMDGWLDGSV